LRARRLLLRARGLLLRGVGPGLARPRRLYARRLAVAFREVRRPGSVGHPRALLRFGELEERLDRVRMLVDRRAGVAARLEAIGHGEDGESAGLGVGYLVPRQRAGDPAVRGGPHAIRGSERPVAGVLVVVDEHAAAFFLPP